MNKQEILKYINSIYYEKKGTLEEQINTIKSDLDNKGIKLYYIDSIDYADIYRVSTDDEIFYLGIDYNYDNMIYYEMIESTCFVRI